MCEMIIPPVGSYVLTTMQKDEFGGWIMINRSNGTKSYGIDGIIYKSRDEYLEIIRDQRDKKIDEILK